jgi:hypothetical protein
MRNNRWIVLPLLLAAGLAHAAGKVEVRGTISAGQYETFQWVEGAPAQRTAAQDFIVAAVERELQAKGLRRGHGETTLQVATYVIVDRHLMQDLESEVDWEYWIGVSTVDAFVLRAGTLVVDLVDTVKDERVWRGVASAKVKDSLERNLKVIDKLLTKMFLEFPAQ